jgi:hypothetical protein
MAQQRTGLFRLADIFSVMLVPVNQCPNSTQALGRPGGRSRTPAQGTPEAPWNCTDIFCIKYTTCGLMRL